MPQSSRPTAEFLTINPICLKRKITKQMSDCEQEKKIQNPLQLTIEFQIYLRDSNQMVDQEIWCLAPHCQKGDIFA